MNVKVALMNSPEGKSIYAVYPEYKSDESIQEEVDHEVGGVNEDTLEIVLEKVYD